jgi:hypothetical protein
LLALAQLAAHWASIEILACSEAEEGVIAGNVISLRILTEEMLPVLSHAASLTAPASDTSTLAEGSTSSVGDAASSLTDSLGLASATVKQDPEQGDSHTPGTSRVGSDDIGGRAPLFPADSTLQLLMAAGHLLAYTTLKASESDIHYTVLAGGLQYIGSNTLTLPANSSNAIAAALDAVLSLTRTLVTKGAWWQEAKAHHPLLLVETLSILAKVSQTMQAGVSRTHQMTVSIALAAVGDAQLKAQVSVVLACCWSLNSGCCLCLLGPCLQSLPLVFQLAVNMTAYGCEHAPGSCSCHVLLSHITGWGGLNSSGPRPEPSTSTCTDVHTQPGTSSGASPAAAIASTAASIITTTNTSSSSSSSSNNNGSCGGQAGNLNAVSLVATVIADLWSLLSDPSIMGNATRPAAWMHPTSRLLLESAGGLDFMLAAMDITLGEFIDVRRQARVPSNTTSSSSSTGGRGGSSGTINGGEGTAVHGALQLMSLVPRVPLSQLQAPVWQQPLIDIDAVHSHCKSGVRMVQLLLRATCVLNAAGLLTKHHCQVVVALLGGVPKCSSNPSNTCGHQRSPLPEEPNDLQHKRVNAGISLAELSDTLLVCFSYGARTLLSRHLLKNFGKKRLPAVAAYQRRGQASLDSVMQERWVRLKGLGILDAYLSWVQETLLLVISEVVSSQQPDPCQVQGESIDQQGSQPALGVVKAVWQC